MNDIETTYCNLCPRNCNVNRKLGEVGYCGQPYEISAARAALHMWEEPCISGERGSGTVFFSGCPLRCVYCQNHSIAIGKSGRKVSVQRLSEIFIELQGKMANNINLVTPTHFVPRIIEAVKAARIQGLSIPIVYNTGSYEHAETIRSLAGHVQVYLPDLKYFDSNIAKKYSNAPDYFKAATAAIAEMVKQCGKAVFAGDDNAAGFIGNGVVEEGSMLKGVIVRHLLLPGGLEDSKKIIKFLYETYGDEIYISIMNQYTPMHGIEKYPELGRRVFEDEYNELVNYAIELGVENGFIQEGETAEESFIPEFDGEGL